MLLGEDGEVTPGARNLRDASRSQFRLGLGLDICIGRDTNEDVGGVGLLVFEELVDMVVVIHLELRVVDRQLTAKPGGFDHEIADDPLFLTLVIVGRRIVVRQGLGLGEGDFTEEPLIREHDRVEIRQLTLAADATFDLSISNIDPASHHRGELVEGQVLGASSLELLRRHLEVTAEYPLIGLRSDKLSIFILEEDGVQNIVAKLLVGDVDSSAVGLFEEERPVGEISHGLVEEVDLTLELLPAVAELLRVLLLEAAHLAEELVSCNDGVAHPDGGVTGKARAARTTRSPINKNQKDKNGHNTPENELEVAEIVAKPFQSHERPPKD